MLGHVKKHAGRIALVTVIALVLTLLAPELGFFGPLTASADGEYGIGSFYEVQAGETGVTLPEVSGGIWYNVDTGAVYGAVDYRNDGTSNTYKCLKTVNISNNIDQLSTKYGDELSDPVVHDKPEGKMFVTYYGDFKTEYPRSAVQPTEVGDYKVSVAIGPETLDDSGEVEQTLYTGDCVFHINTKDISEDAEIVLARDYYQYDGTEQDVVIDKVTYKDKVLDPNTYHISHYVTGHISDEHVSVVDHFKAPGNYIVFVTVGGSGYEGGTFKEFTVVKAPHLYIAAKPVASSLRGEGHKLSEVTLTGGRVEVYRGSDYTIPGTFSWVNPDADLTVGTQKMKVMFTPDSSEADNVDTTPLFTNVSVTVKKDITDSVITTAPAAKEGLTYTGEAQELITEGVAEGGTLMYSLNTGESEDAGVEEFTGTAPSAADAGDYTVYYYVKGDEDHNDVEVNSLNVSIAKAENTLKLSSDSVEVEAGKSIDLSAYVKDACGEVTYKETTDLVGSMVETVSGLFTAGSKTGSCAVTVTADGGSNHNEASKLISITVKEPPHVHSIKAVPAKAPTCTTSGYSAYYVCRDCGKYFSDAAGENEISYESVIAAALGHKLTAHAAKAATCTESGNIAYWTCDNCGAYFADAEGTSRITAAATAIASGHKLTAHEAKAATCTEAGNTAYWTCDVCEKIFSDAEGKTEITEADTVVRTLGHKLTAHEAKAAGCTEAGNIAYWTCDTCEKIFSDAEGKTEIKEEDTVAGALGHSLELVDAVQATYDKEGNIEHWKCTRCGKLFKEEEARTELTEADVIVPKLEAEDISKAELSVTAVSAWTGDEIKPKVTVKYENKLLAEGTDYTLTYENNVDAGTANVTAAGIGNYTGSVSGIFTIKKVNLRYRAYVQKSGWMDWINAAAGKTEKPAIAGTKEALRMETIQMQLKGIKGDIKYRAYVEKMGWTQWAKTSDTSTYAGTKGMSRRVEMIQLNATGEVSELYDIYYRAYAQKFGWLGWAKNLEKAGSAGYAYRLQAFEVRFMPKGVAYDRGTKKHFYDKTKDGANPLQD